MGLLHEKKSLIKKDERCRGPTLVGMPKTHLAGEFNTPLPKVISCFKCYIIR